MADAPQDAAAPPAEPGRKGAEAVAFLLLAFLIWPVVAAIGVGGYGLIVWVFQIFAGPPAV